MLCVIGFQDLAQRNSRRCRNESQGTSTSTYLLVKFDYRLETYRAKLPAGGGTGKLDRYETRVSGIVGACNRFLRLERFSVVEGAGACLAAIATWRRFSLPSSGYFSGSRLRSL